jgi:hypothetical protein
MSKVTVRTEASPDEQSSRAADLSIEIETKLSQARAVCTLICGAGGDEAISEAASAAEDLIAGVEKRSASFGASSAPRRRCSHHEHRSDVSKLRRTKL